MSDLTCPAPSLQPHYRAFIATTNWSAPVPRIGTLPPRSRGDPGFSLLTTMVPTAPNETGRPCRATDSPVPGQGPQRVHGTTTPNTTRATIRQLPGSGHAMEAHPRSRKETQPRFRCQGCFSRCVSSSSAPGRSADRHARRWPIPCGAGGGALHRCRSRWQPLGVGRAPLSSRRRRLVSDSCRPVRWWSRCRRSWRPRPDRHPWTTPPPATPHSAHRATGCVRRCRHTGTCRAWRAPSPGGRRHARSNRSAARPHRRCNQLRPPWRARG